MGKSLIIKGGNFAGNSFDRVYFNAIVDTTVQYSEGTSGTTQTSNYVRHWIEANLAQGGSYNIKVIISNYPVAALTENYSLLTLRLVNSSSATSGQDVKVNAKIADMDSYDVATNTLTFSRSITATTTQYLMALILWPLAESATPSLRVVITPN